MTKMHITHQQEAFSLAYVQAVAAAAGFSVQGGPVPDNQGLDLTIAARGPYGTVRAPRLDLQLKCQRGRPPDGPKWPYDLKVKNYEHLRHTDLQVPRILVVVAVPDDVRTWLDQDEERLLMRHCGWWVSLRGQAASTNTSTVRVRVPRGQRFDVVSLTAMMARVGRGGVP
jgi:hypothetical protein